MLFNSKLLPLEPSQSKQMFGAPVQVLQGEAQGMHTPGDTSRSFRTSPNAFVLPQILVNRCLVAASAVSFLTPTSEARLVTNIADKLTLLEQSGLREDSLVASIQTVVSVVKSEWMCVSTS